MTPTQRAAMEQALEALEAVRSNMRMNAPQLSGKVWGFADETITALRAALAEQPDVETCEIPPLGWHCTRHAGHEGPCAAVANDDRELVSRAMKRLAEQPAEQPAEQEPVGLLVDRFACSEGMCPNKTACGAAQACLYTAPQPAKRVPLTDEEIDLIGFRAVGKVDCQTLKRCVPYGTEIKPLVREIARAIEAAHSIKGETE